MKRIGFWKRDFMATMLLLRGWRRTDLGLYMKRIKWDGGSSTQTYNLATAYAKEFEPVEERNLINKG
jgi:hypothetical protein